MGRVTRSMQSEDLGLRTPNPSNVAVSDDIRQTLATILGYFDNSRVRLHASPSGVLYHASPRLADIVHYTAIAPNEAKQGDDISCTEIVCMAHPDNAGRIWVRTMKAAAANNAIPLDKGDVFGFTVDNLNQLYVLTITSGDTLIVGYSI